MKNKIRITKHKGIDFGYCQNCHSKGDIYKIQAKWSELRLCPECFGQLKIDLEDGDIRDFPRIKLISKGKTEKDICSLF